MTHKEHHKERFELPEPPFDIVSSRGDDGGYDVLGMRADKQQPKKKGFFNILTVRKPGDPGWLGNNFIAKDARGTFTREDASNNFLESIQRRAKDPVWRDAFWGLIGKSVGYYKPSERHSHLKVLQQWLRDNPPPQGWKPGQTVEDTTPQKVAGDLDCGTGDVCSVDEEAYQLNEEDRKWLESVGITGRQQEAVGRVRDPKDIPSVWKYLKPENKTGFLFGWTSVAGVLETQFRPDKPPVSKKDGKQNKYLFAKGAEMVLSVPPGYQERVLDSGVPLVIVEGTKQHLAAASALDTAEGADRFAVVGVTGCQGWKKFGAPIPCFHSIPLEGRRVVIAFDADVQNKRSVRDAAEALAETLKVEFSVEDVRFLLNPRKDTSDGLDDLLKGHPQEKRQKVLLNLLATAKKAIPGRAPAKEQQRFAPQFFGGRPPRFRPATMWDWLKLQHPMAVTREVSTEKAMKGAIAVYEGGVYKNGDSRRFQHSITTALGNDYLLGYTDLVTEIGLNDLTVQRLVIPDRMSDLVVNCRNGLVDVMTGELIPHDPSVLTLFQVPFDFDPEATCPLYEEWLEDRLPGQSEQLEDIASQMLDRTRTPQRFLFLFGPKRSGKSTYQRIMSWMVGPHNCSAVTLHQLSDDRFASANLYGKVLNVAADLSSQDVRDLANLKMLTGEDMVQGNRKYGAQFSFTSQALLCFSANDIPAVNDPSGAYHERATPFHFANSFAGKEDRTLEPKLLAEMPGILNRYIKALRTHHDRGTYLGTDSQTREHFARSSNRVKEFLDEMTRPSVNPEGTKRSSLWTAWQAWAEENGYKSGGRNSFMEKVVGCDVTVFTPKGGSKSFSVVLIDPEKMVDEGVLNTKTECIEPTGKECVTQKSSYKEIKATPKAPKHPEKPRVGTFRIKSRHFLENDQPSQGRAVGTFGGRSALLSHPHIERDSSEGSSESAIRPGCKKSADQGSKVPTISPVIPEKPVVVCNPGRSAVLRPLPPKVPTTPPLVFDLETKSADQLFSPGVEGFVRLVGAGGVADGDVDRVLNHPGPLVAHNGFGFDFLALARHHGFDLLRAGEEGRLIDTMVLASLAFPPKGGAGDGAMKEWGLDHLGQKLLGESKTDGLKKLAKEFGGFDKIPTDHPEFVEYCNQDVTLTEGVLEKLAPGGELTDYAKREMRIYTRLVAGITMNGFRVDADLLHQRMVDGEKRKAEGLQWLVDHHNLPLTTADGKTRAKNPAATAAGKEVIFKVFEEMDVHVGRTDKGTPRINTEVMDEILAAPESEVPQKARDLAEVIKGLNGVRTIYGTMKQHLQGDRVFPTMFAAQANARFSVKPGMTTFGKRGGKVIEREIFLPDEADHVLIALDLSNIDARAVAAHCQDPAYLECFDFDDEGVMRDLHGAVAKDLGITRDAAKPINHGINYGMGDKTLARQSGMSVLEAMRALSGFFRKYPRLEAWQKEVRSQAEKGQTLDNGFGRQMKVHNPDRAYTQAPALVGCGCARDMMMEGILRLPLEVVEMLRMFIHDELVFSVPKARVREIGETVRDALTFPWAPPWGGEPVLVYTDSPDVGINWADCYRKKYEDDSLLVELGVGDWGQANP